MVQTLIIGQCITVYFGLARLARRFITSLLRNKRLYFEEIPSKSVQRLLCTHQYQNDHRYWLFGRCLKKNNRPLRLEGAGVSVEHGWMYTCAVTHMVT